MSAVTFILVVLLALAVGVLLGAYFGEPLSEAWWSTKGRMRRFPPLQRHTGHHRAGAAPVLPLPPAQVIAQADKMRELSAPFLPEVPQHWQPYLTQEEWQSYLNVGKAVEPVKADGHAPWTGSQQKLTPELEAELERQRLIQEQLDARGPNVTAADLREILDALRQPASTGNVTSWDPAQLTYGQTSVADVLAAEAEAGAQPVMLP